MVETLKLLSEVITSESDFLKSPKAKVRMHFYHYSPCISKECIISGLQLPSTNAKKIVL